MRQITNIRSICVRMMLPRPPRTHPADACDANTSRTFRASASGKNGFCRNGAPESRIR